MRIVDRYPIIVTPAKDACRDFWIRWFGLQAHFDSTWFIWLGNEDQSLSIAFMTPDHPSAPPGPEVFGGKGLCFEVQVEDAAAEHDRMVRAGAPIRYPLTDEPFGQRRFGLFDPAGLWIDVVEQTEPASGYWDRYQVSAG